MSLRFGITWDFLDINGSRLGKHVRKRKFAARFMGITAAFQRLEHAIVCAQKCERAMSQIDSPPALLFAIPEVELPAGL
jgi:hypothetical protein